MHVCVKEKKFRNADVCCHYYNMPMQDGVDNSTQNEPDIKYIIRISQVSQPKKQNSEKKQGRNEREKAAQKENGKKRPV